MAGLGTAEIARAFLVSEPTMSQRLLRTRRKISNAAIPYRVPPDELLAERTGGVLAVLYLIFNEGHGQHQGHLAVEALRLARLLVDLMPGEDEARGLLALVAFQMSRRSTRFDANGDLVPMEEQDRGRWDAALIEEGRRQLRRAASSGRPSGPYRLQAQIAACHATATAAEATAWGTIVTLYDALLAAQPSPVIALNRAASAAATRRGVPTRRRSSCPPGWPSAVLATTANRPRETEVRAAFMSTQKVITTYLEGMGLRDNVEPGDFGARRRR